MSRMQGFALPADVTSFVANARARAAVAAAHTGAEDRRWYRITNTASDEAELLLYDDIGGMWGTYAEDFDAELKAVTAKNLTVRVNSPGGSVTEGIAIASMLRAHPANITVRVDGIAASIASVIAMAGDRLTMMPGSLLMIHEASGLCLGDSRDMIKMGEVLNVISENIAEMYAAKSGTPADEWRAKMLDETWLRAEEAVEQGLADEVVQPKKQPEPDAEPEMRKRFDLAAYGYQGPRQEAPTPAPPPAAPEPSPQLVVSLADLLGDEVVAKLRAAVQSEPAAGPVPEVVDTASPVHHTATEDRPWDAGPNEKRLPSPMTVKTAKGMYAWYDEAQVADGELSKAAAKLPHHEVSADGTPGAANLSGVRNALARLPQSDIPASQHDAVRRHLQAHLDDAKGADNQADTEPTAAIEEPEAPEQPAADTWADIVAHLTDDADDWSALVSHLARPASSGAATEA
jgi:ATP-dependent protease ClpP protease subunit